MSPSRSSQLASGHLDLESIFIFWPDENKNQTGGRDPNLFRATSLASAT